MQRFNPADWTMVSADTEFSNQSSKYEVRLSAPGALYLKTGKSKKVLIGHGTYFKGVVEGTSAPVLSATQEAAFFVQEGRAQTFKGVPHTNADKRSEVESATEALVRAAERRIALREKQSRDKMRADFNAMMRRRKEEGLQEEAPEPVEGDADYVKPEPAPEPAPVEGEVRE
jgi:hypothetical protein